MEITRRNFLSTAAVTIVGLGAIPSILAQDGKAAGGLYPIPPESMSDGLSYLTSDHFRPFVGSDFNGVGGGGESITIRLAGVRDLRTRGIGGLRTRGQAYSLMFDGDTPADNYLFKHSSLGEFTLLVNPVNREHAHSEAIVNRRPSGR